MEKMHTIGDAAEELKLARDFIEYKCWYYDVASESGTCDIPKSMPHDELPDQPKEDTPFWALLG